MAPPRAETALRILLVEDDLFDANAFGRLVRRSGVSAHVEHHRSVESAWTRIRISEGAWGLLVLDQHLPDAHGLELLARLRRVDEALPVVVRSTALSRRESALASRLGVEACLEKNDARADHTLALLLWKIAERAATGVFPRPG